MRREDIRPTIAHVIQANRQDSPTPFVVSSARVVFHVDGGGYNTTGTKGAKGIIGLLPMIGTKESLALAVSDREYGHYRGLVIPAEQAAATMRDHINAGSTVKLDTEYTVTPPPGWRWEVVPPRLLRDGDFWEFTTHQIAELNEAAEAHIRRAVEVNRRNQEFGAQVDEIAPIAAALGLDITAERYFSSEGEAWRLTVTPASLLAHLHALAARNYPGAQGLQ